ncbi:MAG: alanine--tRNA ligase-related protein, partial [Candidatus Dormibacteraceae bacterium]
LSVDMEAFEAAMAAQRARSRSPFSGPWDEVREMPRSEFVGYRDLEAPATVLALRAGGGAVDQVTEGQEAEVFLDRTPFYGESGGQVGDTGAIAGADGRLRVEDTRRPADGVVVHLGTVVVGTVRVGERVQAAVDSARRRQIARHHTATHLLHKALREVLGDTVVQKGSWVGPDHTTFDIPLNRAMTAAELERVGRRVNDQVRAALPLRESHRSYREAAESGAMHLFDEKYGDVVRVVSFGDWTSELCGGVHVQSTADVGPALIISESSIGAGLRRLDLVAGESAEDLVRRRLDTLAEVSRTLGGSPDEASRRLAELTAEMRRARRQIAQLTDRLRVASVQASGAGTVSAHQDLAVLENGVPVLVVKVTATDMDDLRAYADRYSETMERPGVVVATSPAISAYVVKVAREHAGDKAGEIDGNRLKALLGPGGGRPALVQGRLERPTPAAADLRGLLG